MKEHLDGDFVIYTSIENDKIKEIKKLQLKKYRDLTNTFIVEGDHLVEEAYEAGLLSTIIIGEDVTLSNKYSNIPTMICNHKVMRFLSELDTPNKVLGICQKKKGVIKGNKILALDNIQDPGNLGTIIRSSVAFNVDTIILSEGTVDLYNSKVIRASQGMIFNTNIVIGNLKDYLSNLDNYKIYGTRVDGGKELKLIPKEDKQIIIMGNEGKGVSKEILDMCDEYLYINMSDKCESLNVAVATSIILYELDK